MMQNHLRLSHKNQAYGRGRAEALALSVCTSTLPFKWRFYEWTDRPRLKAPSTISRALFPLQANRRASFNSRSASSQSTCTTVCFPFNTVHPIVRVCLLAGCGRFCCYSLSLSSLRSAVLRFFRFQFGLTCAMRVHYRYFLLRLQYSFPICVSIRFTSLLFHSSTTHRRWNSLPIPTACKGNLATEWLDTVLLTLFLPHHSSIAVMPAMV